MTRLEARFNLGDMLFQKQGHIQNESWPRLVQVTVTQVSIVTSKIDEKEVDVVTYSVLRTDGYRYGGVSQEDLLSPGEAHSWLAQIIVERLSADLKRLVEPVRRALVGVKQPS